MTFFIVIHNKSRQVTIYKVILFTSDTHMPVGTCTATAFYKGLEKLTRLMYMIREIIIIDDWLLEKRTIILKEVNKRV